MKRTYKELRDFSRELKKNITPAELFFKSRLYKERKNGLASYQFQYIIPPFIVDFYFPKLGLIVELNGGHHYKKRYFISDLKRSSYFLDLGIVTLGITNYQAIMQTDKYIKIIRDFKPTQDPNELKKKIYKLRAERDIEIPFYH